MSKMESLWFLFSFFISIASTRQECEINLEIIGGNNASINDHPWLVSLYSDNHNLECGGFLISSSWLVTTAYCVNDKDLTYGRAGSNATSSVGVVFQFSEKVLHPNYNQFSVANDIALIRLDAPVNGDYIKSIDLPDPETIVPAGDTLQVAGWGIIINDSNVIFPDILQEVDLPAVDIGQCKEIYRDFDLITDNMLCAGYLDDQQQKGPCLGDLGNPLIWNGKPVGIVSWIFACASHKYPTVNTKVSNYVNWIRNVTGV